jgi:Flp pilus assembly protein TadD
VNVESLHQDSPRSGAAAPDQEQSKRVKSIYGAWFIFAAVFAAYAKIWQAGFVWNDADYITRLDLRSLAGLKRIWFEFGATEQYYPLLHSAFWIEHRLWGDAAMGYHVVNLVFHALAAWLFATVLIELFALEAVSRRIPQRGDEVAWFAALLFALHPVSVESVAWIAEQKNTLSTVFYLAAALAYLRFQRSPTASHRNYYWATFLFILALTTKSLTATLPGALAVAIGWAQGSINWKRNARELGAWIILGATMGILSMWVERTYVGAQGAAFDLNLLQRLLLCSHVVWFYLGRLFWPVNWSFIYPRWTIDPTSLVPYVYALGTAGLLVMAWRIRNKFRSPLAVVLIFLGTLFPTIGLFNVYGFLFSYVADHWVYLPSLAVIAGIAAAWPSLGGRAGRFSSAIVLITLGAITWLQVSQYRDEETLYRANLENNPASWMAHDNLGILLAARGALDEAIDHYRIALQLYPQNAEAHNNLGSALFHTGKLDAALQEYQKAISLSPTFAEAHNGRGIVLEALGRNDEAAAAFERALQLRPTYVDPENNLGSLLLRENREEEAEQHFQRVLAFAPNNAEAHCNMGTVNERQGHLLEASAEYQLALKLNPRLAEAHNDLANVMMKQGRYSEAVKEYSAAATLQPTSSAIYSNLGLALGYAGRFSEAAQAYRKVLQLDPRNEAAQRQMEKAERMGAAHRSPQP